MNFTAFSTLLRETFPWVTEQQLERFAALDPLYREWNARINVISRKDMDGLYLHHVLHSLAIAAWLQRERPDTFRQWQEGGVTVLDLGTGGGFPGIPLAILFPQVTFTLCDSIGKKIRVASEIAGALGLENVQTVNARAESLGRTFTHVVSRAVTTLDQFYPWVKGRFTDSILYLKGGDIAEETGVLMARHRLPAGSVSVWKIQNDFPDPWFEGKFVVEIRKNAR